jgi:hypothetical protein
MKLEKESLSDIPMTTVEADDSTLFLLQLYPDSFSPETIRANLLKGLRNEFATYRAKFPNKATEPCQRQIGGKIYQGVKLSFRLFGMPHVNEIYSMQKHGKTLGMVFHYAVEDKDKAFPRFEVITSSFQ